MSRMVPASPFSSVNPAEAPSFTGAQGRDNVNILRATHRRALDVDAPRMLYEDC